MPVSRIANIGKGVCYDQARYHAYLASKYKLTYRCFLYISTDQDGVPYDRPGNEHTIGDSHADCYIYADNKWYYNSTTGSYRKQLMVCDGDKLDYVLAAILSDRIKYGQRTDVRGATSQEISDTVASTMVDYFNQYRSKAAEMLYEVTDFADAKYDNMTYRKLVEHVVKNCKPYVFDDKVLAAVKNDKLSYDDLMFNVA